MKKLICAALLLSAVSAYAAPQAADKKQAEPTPPAVPAQKAPEKTVPTPEEAVKQLAALDQAVQTLQFNFKQTLFFDETGITREVAGNVHFSKPDKIRIEHSKPQPQIVYTDKKTILIYKPADRQALKSSWKQWLSQQASTLTGIAEMGDYSSLASRHEISVSRNKDNSLNFAMRPKNSPKAYTLTFVLADTDYFPRAIIFSVGKTRFETIVSEVKRNADLPAAIFEFKQPPGVDLIDFSGPAQ